MELITVNNKTEYITSFNSAMELVENKCGLELAQCIQDMHQQALAEQKENNPYTHTDDDMYKQAEYFENKMRDITQDLEELQEYIKHAKRLDHCKMLKYLEKTLDISSSY